MARGSAEWVEMKGFNVGLQLKGDGQTPETLPPDSGADVTDTASVDSAMARTPRASNIKPGENKPGTRGVTMAKDVQDEVTDNASTDVSEGYTSDVQHLPGPGTRAEKGYERYNEMVAKGVAVDVAPNVDRFTIKQFMGDISQAADRVAAESMAHGSPWTSFAMKGDQGMTVFKGMSALQLKMPVTAEDVPGSGLTERPGNEEGVKPEEGEKDDTKETSGENESPPQTEEARKEDEQFSETGPEQEKGAWQAVRSGTRRAVRAIAPKSEGARYAAALGAGALGMTAANAGIGAATGAGAAYAGNKNVRSGAKRGAVGGMIAGPVGGAIGGLTAQEKKKKSPGSDYGMVTKGIELEEKGYRDVFTSRTSGLGERALNYGKKLISGAGKKAKKVTDSVSEAVGVGPGASNAATKAEALGRKFGPVSTSPGKTSNLGVRGRKFGPISDPAPAAKPVKEGMSTGKKIALGAAGAAGIGGGVYALSRRKKEDKGLVESGIVQKCSSDKQRRYLHVPVNLRKKGYEEDDESLG